MILIGQYDSPFVRRAAVALNHHGIAFERKVLSTFTQFDAVREANPLGKVPVLVLDDGTTLPDSRAIIEYLDLQAPAGRRLLPSGQDAREVLQVESVAIGLAEKVYERGIETNRRAPGTQDPVWMARLEAQIASALAWLEPRVAGDWAVGGGITRADLAIVTALTFLAEKQPRLWAPDRYPNLASLRARAETLPIFAKAAYSAKEALKSGWRPDAE